MRAIRTNIGNAEVLIETMQENIEILNKTETGRATRTTSISEDMVKAYEGAKTVIKEIATDIGLVYTEFQTMLL